MADLDDQTIIYIAAGAGGGFVCLLLTLVFCITIRRSRRRAKIKERVSRRILSRSQAIPELGTQGMIMAGHNELNTVTLAPEGSTAGRGGSEQAFQLDTNVTPAEAAQGRPASGYLRQVVQAKDRVKSIFQPSRAFLHKKIEEEKKRSMGHTVEDENDGDLDI